MEGKMEEAVPLTRRLTFPCGGATVVLPSNHGMKTAPTRTSMLVAAAAFGSMFISHSAVATSFAKPPVQYSPEQIRKKAISDFKSGRPLALVLASSYLELK